MPSGSGVLGQIVPVRVDQGGEFPVGADVALVERAEWCACQEQGQFEQVVGFDAVPVDEAGELVEDADGAAVCGGRHPDLVHRASFGGEANGGDVVVMEQFSDCLLYTSDAADE